MTKEKMPNSGEQPKPRKGAMDKEVKRKWIRKLRSKNIVQCREVLYDSYDEEGEAFCCMGVLGLIIGGEKHIKKNGDSCLRFGSSTRDTLLSERKLESVGLTKIDQEWLVKMNDDYKSFSEIADYIRDNL